MVGLTDLDGSLAGEEWSEWAFSFVPRGWAPTADLHVVELIYLPTFDWPVVVLTAEVVLHPPRSATARPAHYPGSCPGGSRRVKAW